MSGAGDRVGRTAELEVPADRFEPRLIAWAKAAECKCTGRGPVRWTFRRGGFLGGWPKGDIDRLPTEAAVEVVSEVPFTIRASLEIRFGNRMSSRGEDEADVDQRLGLMLAYLRGVYDF